MPDDWKEYNHTTEKPHSTDVWSPAYVFSRRVKVTENLDLTNQLMLLCQKFKYFSFNFVVC